MRKLLTTLVAGTLLVSAAGIPARAGQGQCSGPCELLHEGHVRGRLPIPCVHIPFIKEKYGYVAMFVVDKFDPQATPDEIHHLLDPKNPNVRFWDSKVTGPVNDFCRNPKLISRGHWVVLCDEDHLGWITGETLQYAIKYGRPPDNERVPIGTHVQ